MDMDISSDSSSSHGTYWDSNVGLPFTDSVRKKNFRLGAFFYQYIDNYRVLSIYLGNKACLHVKYTYFSASL